MALQYTAWNALRPWDNGITMRYTINAALTSRDISLRYVLVARFA